MRLLAMQRLFCAVVLSAALSLLTWHVERVGLTSERPYEEALYRVALRHNAAILQCAEEAWTEHPALPYLMLRLCRDMVGEDIRVLRLIWGAVFLAAFAGTLYFVWSPARGSAMDDHKTHARDGLDAATAVNPGEGSAGDRSRNGTRAVWLRGILVFAAFVSPPVLIAGVRIGPDAFAYLALAGMLIAGKAFCESGSLHAAFPISLASVAVSFSHAYGVFVALSLLFGLVVMLGIAARRAALLKFSLAAAVACVAIGADGRGLWARLTLVRNHYWAGEASAGVPGVPLAGIWDAATEIAGETGWVPEALQIGALTLLVWIAIRSKDVAARVAALGSLGCWAGLWALGVVTGDAVVIHHWLGMLLILGLCATARGLQGWLLGGASVMATVVVFVPGVAASVMILGDGPGSIREAAAEVQRLTTQADAVVFGGTRAYILLEPELEASVLDRSYVYLREGAFPDSFIGRRLISPERLVPAEEWPVFHQQRVVVVMLEAAQKVDVPTDGWDVKSRSQFIHNANSIGEITVEWRQKVR